MVNFTLRKLLGMIPMLLIITFLIYAGIEMMPGDVIDFLIPMDQLAEMTEEEVAAFRAAKGLDGPMIVRYFNWLLGVCKGDLGYSLQNNMPVAELMMQKLPATVELSLASLILSSFLGILLGLYVGYKGGLLDNLLIKISDIFQSVPQMVLIIIFILTGWPGMYRMTRSKVLSLKQQEFVQALRAFGISDVKIAFKHLLPNCLGPVVVNITLSTAMFILQEASLSVLGYGVPMEIATWGNIINVITNGGTIRFDWLQYWWMWLPCAIMLILFVLSINFIGDGLRDASDPTQIG